MNYQETSKCTLLQRGVKSENASCHFKSTLTCESDTYMAYKSERIELFSKYVHLLNGSFKFCRLYRIDF